MSMPYRRLGRSGLKVSLLSLGSWISFGNQVDDDLAVRCLDAAREGGVNFFDNAESYAGGQSEAIMGRAFKTLGWERHEYVVSSKFFWGIHNTPNMTNTLNRKYLMQAVDASLGRFGLDFLDLVFCHRATRETPIEETVRAMSDIVSSGKALYWGTSEWAADEIVAAIEIAERHHLYKPIVEQPQYNLLQRRRVEHEYARADRGLRNRPHHIQSPCCGPAHGQVPGRNSGAVSRRSCRLRMAPSHVRRLPQQREGAGPQSRRRRSRLSARAARHRLVCPQPRCVNRHHGSESSRPAAGELALARRARAA